MLKDVLDLPEGFSTKEDEDYIYLKYKGGRTIAIFSSKGATIENIKEAAEKYLKNPLSSYYFCRNNSHQVPAGKIDLPCICCGSLPPHMEIEIIKSKGAFIYICSECNYQAGLFDALEICPSCSTLNSFRKLKLAAGAEA